MSPTETQTPTFPAVTTRGLTFWAISFGGDGRRFPPGTRVSVTVLETGQHCMSTSAEGVTYSRFSSAYDTRSPLPEATATAEEVGGIDLGTEYGDKVAELAFELAKLPYPWMTSWADVEPELVDNYMMDAAEIIRSYPHLLSLPERERLAPLYPEVAI